MEVPKPFKLCPKNLDNLFYDEACLEVINKFNEAVQLRSVSSECYEVSVRLGC